MLLHFLDSQIVVGRLQFNFLHEQMTVSYILNLGFEKDRVQVVFVFNKWKARLDLKRLGDIEFVELFKAHLLLFLCFIIDNTDESTKEERSDDEKS